MTEQGYYFIFDNVPFHHNKEMLKLILDSGHKYIFTPAYSPNNNPIETVFGSVKNNFRNMLNEKNKNNENICIKNLIKQSVKTFNEKNNKGAITKLFKHSIKYDYTELEKELRDRLIIIKQPKTQPQNQK